MYCNAKQYHIARSLDVIVYQFKGIGNPDLSEQVSIVFLVTKVTCPEQ